MYRRFGSYNGMLRVEHSMRVYPDGRAVLTTKTRGKDARQISLNFEGFTPEQRAAGFIVACQMAERE